MTKACWRHIFFILPLIISIFWSGLAPAQSFGDLLDDIPVVSVIKENAESGIEMLQDPSMENIGDYAGKVSSTGVRLIYKTFEKPVQTNVGTIKNVFENTGVITKAVAGDKEAIAKVENKITQLKNQTKRGMNDSADILEGYIKYAFNPDPVARVEGLQQLMHGMAQSGQDGKVFYDRFIKPNIKDTALDERLTQLVELAETGQDMFFSDTADGIVKAMGNDAVYAAYQMLKKTKESVATGTGQVTYDGNCKIDNETLGKIKDVGSAALEGANAKMEEFKKGYDALADSGKCNDVIYGLDSFKNLVRVSLPVTDAAKDGAKVIGQKEEDLIAVMITMDESNPNFASAKYMNIDAGYLAQKAAAAAMEGSESEKSRYKYCQSELEKLKAVRGNNQNDKDSFMYYLHEANNSLSVVAVLSGVSDMADVDCTCERDAQGNETGKIESCTAKNNGELENNMPETCKSVAAYMQDFSANCIVCAKFATILGAAQKISENAFTATADGFIKLLTIGLLLYIGYLTLITIGSPETQKLSKYLTSLLIQGFKVAIAVLILQNPTFLYEKVVTPILDGGLDFGLTLNGTGLAAAKDLGTSYADKFNANSRYLGGDIVQSLTGTVHGFQNAAADIPGMGRALICNAFNDKVLGVFPHFTLLFNGILLLIFGLFIMLAIGFYIFDCAVELCLICALMAFFVACWPFKLTSAYTRVGWNMLLNIFFNFVMMGIIVKTINELISFSLNNMGKDELMNILDTGNPTLIDQAFDMGGNSILLVIICCILCLKMTKESGNLANKFASGAQIQIGAQLATLAASAATAVGVGAVQVFNPASAGQSAAAAGAVAANGQMEMLENDAARQMDAAKNAAGMSAAGKGKTKGLGRLLSSVAEHTGAKNAISKATNSIQSKLMSAAGKVGIGAGAEMGSKGRDNNANQKDRKAEF